MLKMQNNLKAILYSLLGYGVYATHDALVKFVGEFYASVQILFFSTLFSFPIIALMLIRDTSTDNLRPKRLAWSLLRVMAMLVSALSTFYAFAVVITR